MHAYPILTYLFSGTTGTLVGMLFCQPSLVNGFPIIFDANLETAAKYQPQLGFALLQIDEQYWNEELNELASSFPVSGFPARTIVISPTVKTFQHGIRKFSRTQFPVDFVLLQHLQRIKVNQCNSIGQ